MGYLVNVIQAGIEYADRYHVPEYVAKARCSSAALDVTAGKLDTLLREHGPPLVAKVDNRLDGTLATAQLKKDEVLEMAQQAKTKTLEFAQGKRTEALDAYTGVKDVVSSNLQDLQTRAEEKKAQVYDKAQEVATSSKAQLELASSKAVSSKASLEKQLLQRCEGNAQATKSAQYAIGLADRSVALGVRLVTKSLALPLTLPDRLTQTMALTKQVVPKTKACAQDLLSRVMLLLVAVKVQALAAVSKREELYTAAAAYVALATTQVQALRSRITAESLLTDLKALGAQAVEQAQNVYTEVQLPRLMEQAQAKVLLFLEPFGVLPLVSQAQQKVLALLGRTKVE